MVFTPELTSTKSETIDQNPSVRLQNIGMYELDPDKPLTRKDVQRYDKTNDELDYKIALEALEYIERRTDNPDDYILLTLLSNTTALESYGEELRNSVKRYVESLLDDQVSEESKDYQNITERLTFIDILPPEEKIAYLRRLIGNKNSIIDLVTLDVLPDLHDINIAEFLEEVISKEEDVEVLRRATEKIKVVDSIDSQLSLLKIALGKDEEIGISLVEDIDNIINRGMFPEQRKAFVTYLESLHNPNYDRALIYSLDGSELEIGDIRTRVVEYYREFLQQIDEDDIEDIDVNYISNLLSLIRYEMPEIAYGMRDAITKLCKKLYENSSYEESFRIISFAHAKYMKEQFYRCLNSSDSSVSSLAVAESFPLSHEDRIEFLASASLSEFSETRSEAYKQFYYLTRDEKLTLLEKNLFDETEIEVIENMYFVFRGLNDSQQEQIQKLVKSKLAQIESSSTSTKDLVFRYKYARFLKPVEAQEEYEALSHTSSFEFSSQARDLAEYFKEHIETPELPSKSTGHTRLYDNDPMDPYFKRNFQKTGSELVLYDSVHPDLESLKYRLITRKIERSAYLAWRFAFESADFWKQRGYEYVPIEPIVDVVGDKDHNLVNVQTRVLDTSAGEWVRNNTLHRDYIISTVSRLNKDLFDLGVVHGHSHPFNYCLRFKRNADGSIDYNERPNIYIIDFDQAIMSNIFTDLTMERFQNIEFS